MTSFFVAVLNFWTGLISLFIRIRFDFFGYTIDLFSFIIMMLLISAVINILWRGAKS